MKCTFSRIFLHPIKGKPVENRVIVGKESRNRNFDAVFGTIFSLVAVFIEESLIKYNHLIT
jgi:hypothetical protein